MAKPHRPLDDQELDRLVDVYSDLVFRICFARLHNEQDARDACQTVFLKFVAMAAWGLIAFDCAEHERAWFIRAAITTCIDAERNGWSQKVVPLEDPGRLEQLAQASAQPRCDEDPAQHLCREEERARVLDALAGLSDTQRTAVYLHYFEDYSVSEIAQLTGEQPNTVSQHLSRARAKLRTLLEGGAR